MSDQRCPNCQAQHDVSIFVTGQRVRCSKCGIRFEVVRRDASFVAGAQQKAVGGSSSPSPGNQQVNEAGTDGDSIEGTGEEIGEAGQNLQRDAETGTSSGPVRLGERSAVAVSEDATAISQGLVIPGFEVLNVLGRGGMGDVYLARQASLNRNVAIKVLARHVAGDPDFVRRFEKEAQALATLSHPNIVSIIDRGSYRDTLYFVMEYVEGHSLRDVLRKGPLEPFEAIKVVTQVSSAIDYAHACGVIHRDLKPENILIDVHGHVKVADFGLAGIIGCDERIHITRTDVAMGTFNYMAPEQRRNAREVDSRADLFSLGVVLYELLTGEVPVGRFRLPGEVTSGLDPRIDSIVERALQNDPADRYQRASAIYDDLRQVVGSETVTLSADSTRSLESRDPPTPGQRDGQYTTRISKIAKSAESVVDRTSQSLFKVARLGVAVVALMVVGVGIVGSFKLAGWLWGGDADELRAVSVSQPERDRGPRRPMERVEPPKGPLTVPLQLRVDGEDDGFARRIIDFTDDTSGTIVWHHHRGWWEHREGYLVQDVFMAGHGVVRDRVVPRAFVGGERYFFDGYRLELTVTLDTTPPVRGRRAAEFSARRLEVAEGEAPHASLYLYRNMRHFLELTVRLGDDGGFELRWMLDDAEREGVLELQSQTEPTLGTPIRLALWVAASRVHVEVDGVPAGSALLGSLGEDNWGKAGVGCHLAVCTFESVLIEGYTRQVPDAVASN